MCFNILYILFVIINYKLFVLMHAMHFLTTNSAANIHFQLLLIEHASHTQKVNKSEEKIRVIYVCLLDNKINTTVLSLCVSLSNPDKSPSVCWTSYLPTIHLVLLLLLKSARTVVAFD